MDNQLERTVDGLQFAVDDRRYRILSPLQRGRQGQVELTITLYHGAGDACLQQDQVNTSTVKGRQGSAQSVRGLEAQVIEQDLLALDAAVRQTLDQEASQDRAQPSPLPPRGSRIEQGECAYYRVVTTPNGTEVRTPISSFVIEPKLRVWIDGDEAVHADLRLAGRTIPDVTFERDHWRSRGAFLKALASVDLQCVASANRSRTSRASWRRQQCPTSRARGRWATTTGGTG